MDDYEVYGGIKTVTRHHQCPKCRKPDAVWVRCEDGTVVIECDSCKFEAVEPPTED